MSVKTISENHFEDFCSQKGLILKRVQTAGTPTPDYELLIGGVKVIVEIKQFDPNPEEKRAKLVSGKVMIINAGKLGERIRKAISEAIPQLKALSKGIHPSLLMLYNNTLFTNHTGDIKLELQCLDMKPTSSKYHNP